MTEENQNYIMVLGAVSLLPPDEKAAVESACEKIYGVLRDQNVGIASIAIALIGVRMQAEGKLPEAPQKEPKLKAGDGPEYWMGRLNAIMTEDRWQDPGDRLQAIRDLHQEASVYLHLPALPQ